MLRLGLRFFVTVFAVFCCDTGLVCSATFSPATFQQPDGAVTLNAGGDYVEPYFATKALIVAQDGGLDIHDAATAWINWALPRQGKDGLFRRYCRREREWLDCAPADADDSMEALWMQLLYRMAPSTGMPASWEHSVALSTKQLQKLHNRRLGLYHVSKLNHVALFMDNIEVYAAFKDVARQQKRLSDPAASATDAEAERLASAIQKVFWDRHSKRFRPSMQKSRPAFYPDVVAQVYPWLADVSGPGQHTREAWEQWKRAFGAGWIERRYDSHAWGLIAIAAEKLGDASSAECWTSQSDALRGSNEWNVLEEAAWQALHARFPQSELLNPKACTTLRAQQ
jgi:hypothetical protein